MKKAQIQQDAIVHLFPCGQCMNCRINQSRVWKNRLLLEAKDSQFAFFVTLTYNDEHLPHYIDCETGEVVGILNKKHHQGFLKRLRKSIEPHRLRFYCVGEYGSQNWRPHYHLAIFTTYPITKEHIENAWCDNGLSMGYTDLGDISSGSAAYIAGYIQKKATQSYLRNLGDRPKEYATMSNKNGGIGIGVINKIAEVLRNHGSEGTIQHTVQAGKKSLPIGRYLTCKLAEKTGVDPKQFTAEYYQYLEEIDSEHDMSDSRFLNRILDKNRGARKVAEQKQLLYKPKRRLG